MTETITRYYLEIKSVKELKEIKCPNKNFKVSIVEPFDFQLNKFFYKQIGKKHHWKDRLVWTDQNWISYVSNKNLKTYILKEFNDLVGYYELIFHEKEKEVEIAYFGILENYLEKGLGGFLLSDSIKKSFSFDIKKIWLHTCSRDHKNALKNYLSRGLRIFKTESLRIKKI